MMLPLWLAACHGPGARSPAAAPASGPDAAPASGPPAAAPGPCSEPAAGAERLTLEPRGTATARDGLAVTFAGSGHDDFEDGRFDEWAQLVFRAGGAEEQRLVSLLALPHVTEVLGRCVRVEGGATRLSLDIWVR